MEGMFLSAEMKYCAVIQIAHRDVSSIDILPLDMRSTVLVCLWNIVRCRLQRERAQRLLFHNEHAEVTTTKDALCQLHLLSAFDICKLTQRLEPHAREGYVRAAQCREAFGDFTGALREVVAALRIDAETSAATENLHDRISISSKFITKMDNALTVSLNNRITISVNRSRG